MNVIRNIGVFIWFVAIGTIFAGIVGISNVMLITVKERTREIGVRKALGATPVSIVSLVLQESIFITALSGYFGLVAGIGALELMQTLLADVEYVRTPGIDIGVALWATAILIGAGAIAGFFPAVRAARIRPIQALRTE